MALFDCNDEILKKTMVSAELTRHVVAHQKMRPYSIYIYNI